MREYNYYIKKIKISLLVVLTGILLCSCHKEKGNIKPCDYSMTVLENANVSEAFENAKRTEVQIHVFDFSLSLDKNDITNPSVSGCFGSGNIFLIDEERIIIGTNYHVIKYLDYSNENKCYVTFFNGVTKEAKLQCYDKDLDIAFLKIDPKHLDEEVKKELKSVVLDDVSNDRLSDNSIIFLIHSKQIERSALLEKKAEDKVADTCFTGIVIQKEAFVESLNKNMLYINCYVEDGMSGTGTFDEYGNYVGMLEGGTEDKMAVSISYGDVKKYFKNSVLLAE